MIDKIISESIRHVLNEMRFDSGMVFVTYLKRKYHPKDVSGVSFTNFTDCVYPWFDKCRGGLWACPLGSKRDWDAFCHSNGLSRGGIKFCFRLKPGAKIYAINTAEDYYRIATANAWSHTAKTINWDKLIKKGYDGIYVSSEALSSNKDIIWDDRHYIGLTGWDVESICIFNPDVIFPVSSENVGEYEGFIIDDDDW